MPVVVRTYGVGDLSNLNSTGPSTPTASIPPHETYPIPTAGPVSFTTFLSGAGLASNADPGLAAIAAANWEFGNFGSVTYQVFGDLNFAASPNIPLNAQIVKIVNRFTISNSISASAQAQPGFPASIDGGASASSTGGGNGAVVGPTGVNDGTLVSDTDSLNEAFEGIAFESDEFNPPLTYDELVTQFGTVFVFLQGFGGGVAAQAGSTASVDYSASISGWEMEVHYIPSDPPNPNDIIGNLVLSLLDESEFSPLYMVGDLEIALELDSPVVSNEIIGDLSIALGIESEFAENATFIGDLFFELTLDSDTVYSADASGLYTIVPGKRNDTLYQREDVEDTIDVKIPNPQIKTAFVGS